MVKYEAGVVPLPTAIGMLVTRNIYVSHAHICLLYRTGLTTSGETGRDGCNSSNIGVDCSDVSVDDSTTSSSWLASNNSKAVGLCEVLGCWVRVWNGRDAAARLYATKSSDHWIVSITLNNVNPQQSQLRKRSNRRKQRRQQPQGARRGRRNAYCWLLNSLMRVVKCSS